MSLPSFLRRLVRRPAPSRPAPTSGRFVPTFTALEGRDVPSGGGLVPFKEWMTHVGAAPAGLFGGDRTTVDVTDRHGHAHGHARTVTVPFKLTGGGPAAAGLPLVPGWTAAHTSTGTATLLGRHTGFGEIKLESLNISPTGAVTGTFSGKYTFVAANGDKLVVVYGAGGTGKLTGQVSADGTSVSNVLFDAVFTPDPAASTGRFAGAGGGFRMIAKAESVSLVSSTPGFTAPFEYTWTGTGRLVLRTGHC